MANPSEGTGGSPEAFDISRNDERKSTDTRMKDVPNAKTGGGSEVRDLDGEGLRSGYRRIEAGKTKAQEGETPQDPAAPSSPGHIPADGPTGTPLPNQGVKR